MEHGEGGEEKERRGRERVGAMCMNVGIGSRGRWELIGRRKIRGGTKENESRRELRGEKDGK